jgi:hypothetical protein
MNNSQSCKQTRIDRNKPGTSIARIASIARIGRGVSKKKAILVTGHGGL